MVISKQQIALGLVFVLLVLLWGTLIVMENSVSDGHHPGRVTRINLASVKVAALRFHLAYGKFPSGDTSMIFRQLSGENPKGITFCLFSDRGMNNRVLLDAWKQPFQCYVDTNGEFVVYSFGPNQKDEKGQGDDMVCATRRYNRYMADGTQIFYTIKEVSVPLTPGETRLSAPATGAKQMTEDMLKPENQYEWTFWVQPNDEKTSKSVWHFVRTGKVGIYDVQYKEETLIVLLQDEKRVVVYLVPGNAEGTVLFQKCDPSEATISGSLKDQSLKIEIYTSDGPFYWHWDGKEWIEEKKTGK